MRSASGRILLGSSLALILAASLTFRSGAQSPGPLRFADLVSRRPQRAAARRPRAPLHFRRWQDASRGRRAINTARTARGRSSASTSTASSPGRTSSSTTRIVGWPARSLKDIPAGDYLVQALFNRYETFHRADGHTVKMPMDQGEGQHWEQQAGQLLQQAGEAARRPGERRRDQDLDGPGDSADRAAEGHGAGEVPPRARTSA